MSWEVEVTRPQEFENEPLCPAGLYPAAVVAVIDLGTHLDDTDYGQKDRRHVAVAYELAVPRPDGQPFVFAEDLTFSGQLNSHLYKRYASLVGALQPGEKLNPSRLLGRPCSVAVIHKEGGKKANRTYANLSDVTPPMYGQQPHAPRRQPLEWAIFMGTPLPDASWIPPMFGKTVKSLVEACHEAKAGKFPVVASRPQQPSQAQQPQQQYQQAPPPQQYQQPAPVQQAAPQQYQQAPQQAFQQPAPQQYQQPAPVGYAPQPQQYQQVQPQQARQPGDDDIPF